MNFHYFQNTKKFNKTKKVCKYFFAMVKKGFKNDTMKVELYLGDLESEILKSFYYKLYYTKTVYIYILLLLII